MKWIIVGRMLGNLKLDKGGLYCLAPLGENERQQMCCNIATSRIHARANGTSVATLAYYVLNSAHQ